MVSRNEGGAPTQNISFSGRVLGGYDLAILIQLFFQFYAFVLSFVWVSLTLSFYRKLMCRQLFQFSLSLVLLCVMPAVSIHILSIQYFLSTCWSCRFTDFFLGSLLAVSFSRERAFGKNCNVPSYRLIRGPALSCIDSKLGSSNLVIL